MLLHAPIGELPYDAEECKVQCHLCGKWFVLIGSSHVVRKHGIDAEDYRRIAGLHPRQALAAPSFRADRAEHMLRRLGDDERVKRGMQTGTAMARSGELQAMARKRAAQRATSAARARQLEAQGRELGLGRSARFRAQRETRARALGFRDLRIYYRQRYVSDRARLDDLCAELGASWSAVRADLRAAGVVVTRDVPRRRGVRDA